MCGLDVLRDGKILFARNRKECDCPACEAAVVRTMATRTKLQTVESSARQKQFLENKSWKPNS